MGAMSIWHWVIVIAVIALLFGGRGKLSGLMGDAAKGIRAFKDGLKDDDKKDGPADGVSSLPRTEAEKDELKR
ncbi:twin-arginine translocase TatA/TatE family subunit [Brevundimonas sp.]|uniref:twin-arginine translocase TatA/TatE family subunit n=1 Tax=Brevundimonas sp. TaxID=1871086 RepID=UPI002E103889|nr:twin-arginine translocase TatA/TatE family subunit [Brevundimonas sp.]